MLQSCQTAQAGNTTSDYDHLKTDLLRVWASLPVRGQLITDTYTRKFVHMLKIPFPVCAYATIYYKKKIRQLVLVVFHFYNKLWHKHKQEIK